MLKLFTIIHYINAQPKLCTEETRAEQSINHTFIYLHKLTDNLENIGLMKAAIMAGTFVPLFTYDQQSSEEASNKQEISFFIKKIIREEVPRGNNPLN
jgi:hypothetical protein